MDKREHNVCVFQDTERHCKNNTRLITAISRSNEGQYICYETESVKVEPKHRFTEPAEIMVSKKRSLEAAGQYRGKKVCVHNFASATNPGGGVTRGSNAQEEAICRCSSLYFNVSIPSIVSGYHNRHREMLKSGAMDVTYNDDCIFTPGVVVFKSDTSSPELMEESAWYEVDVITCAAPNLREHPENAMNPGGGSKSVRLSDSALLALHEKRAERIFSIAKSEKEDVLILGAFGCGAFCNSPKVVAEAMKKTIEKYRYDFKTIEFAVYCSAFDSQNYDVFRKVILV